MPGYGAVVGGLGNAARNHLPLIVTRLLPRTDAPHRASLASASPASLVLVLIFIGTTGRTATTEATSSFDVDLVVTGTTLGDTPKHTHQCANDVQGLEDEPEEGLRSGEGAEERIGCEAAKALLTRVAWVV